MLFRGVPEYNSGRNLYKDHSPKVFELANQFQTRNFEANDHRVLCKTKFDFDDNLNLSVRMPHITLEED